MKIDLASLFPPERIRRIAWVWLVCAWITFAGDWLRFFDGASFHYYRIGDPWAWGGDFLNFWSGPALALQNRFSEIYNWAKFAAFQQTFIQEPALDPHNYSYPPSFLLLSLPLGLMPYGIALCVWTFGGIALFVAALKRFAPSSNALFLALATPAIFLNALGGQNGMLSAAALGGGLALLPTNPVGAGALFGLLSVKPHLGLLIPIALVARREGRAFAAAALTSLTLIALSLVCFGPDLWSAYAAHAEIMRHYILETPMGAWHRFVSLFVAVRMAGASVFWAYALQACAACVFAFVLWREGKQASAARFAALLILGTFWATPYVQDYDMPILTFACLALAETERETGNHHPNLLLASAACLLLAPLFSAPIARISEWTFEPGPLFFLPALSLLSHQKLEKHT